MEKPVCPECDNTEFEYEDMCDYLECSKCGFKIFESEEE